eukprot:Em0016g178a
MRWKWLFFGLLAAGVGLVWNNEKSRRELVSELNGARVFVNKVAKPYEAWQIIFISVGLTLLVTSLYSFLFREDQPLFARFKKSAFAIIRSLPIVKGKIKAELDKAKQSLENDNFVHVPGEKICLELPAKGLTAEEVLKEISDLNSIATVEWKKGWASGTAYNCSPELTALNKEVYGRFIWSNPLHVQIFPDVRKMEAEVVQWTVKIFNGGPDACGTMTSGGTESILMAMRAYRQAGYERGIRYPEIVCAETAHCAFKKAADYFKMKLTSIPVDPLSRKVNLRAMANAISSNTVVLIGSAPHFPHGIVDPIEEMAAIGRACGIGVHVDCCLGGFILPFMDKAGYPIPPFDFRVRGVTSISADTHKYGYTPKGTSVVMYSSQKLRRHQYFVETSWPGGVYATPTIAGSRPGALIATCWATMRFVGTDGYVDMARRIVGSARKIKAALKGIPGVFVMGDPQASIVAFGSKEFDIYRLYAAMTGKGWHLSSLQYPPSVHICLTAIHTEEGVVDRFIGDMKECAGVIMKTPKAKTTGMAAVYGTSQSIPDRSLVDDIAASFIDLCYRVRPPPPPPSSSEDPTRK